MAPDKMQAQRWELKYRLTEEVAHQVREFVAGYMEVDEHGVGKPNYSYPVHSLYLDSDDFATYWMTINGDKNRFKLRLRFYNDHPDTPVFFEVKRRRNHCIYKQRGGVRKEAVPAVLQGQLPESKHLVSKDSKHLVAVQAFSSLMLQLRAHPKAHVAYLREAWVYPDSNAARVTFDRQVCIEPRFTPYFATTLKNPALPFGSEVILELKFTDRFPTWFRELVEHFDLFQCGAAKYCEGLEAIGLNRLGAQARFAEDQVLHATDTLVSLEH